jgi:hypothetical protein
LYIPTIPFSISSVCLFFFFSDRFLLILLPLLLHFYPVEFICSKQFVMLIFSCYKKSKCKFQSPIVFERWHFCQHYCICCHRWLYSMALSSFGFNERRALSIEMYVTSSATSFPSSHISHQPTVSFKLAPSTTFLCWNDSHFLHFLLTDERAHARRISTLASVVRFRPCQFLRSRILSKIRRVGQ